MLQPQTTGKSTEFYKASYDLFLFSSRSNSQMAYPPAKKGHLASFKDTPESRLKDILEEMGESHYTDQDLQDFLNYMKMINLRNLINIMVRPSLRKNFVFF